MILFNRNINSTKMFQSYLLVLGIFMTCMASDQFLRVSLYSNTILPNNASSNKIPLNYTRAREFYGKVSVGTPPQNFNVLYDTGSSDMWLVSAECTTPECMKYHRYDHKKSSTYINNGTLFNYTYGAGNVSGYWSYDDVTVGDIKVKKQQLGEVKLLQLITPPGKDGIVGLSFKRTGVNTLMDNMIQQNITRDPVVSFYMSSHFQEPDQVGEMVLGGSDPEHYIGDLTYVPIVAGAWYWAIILDGLYVNGKNFLPMANSIGIDTGSQGLYGPTELIRPMLKELGTDDKHNISCSEVSKQPDIVFEINGKNFPLKAKNYYRMVEDDICQIDVHYIQGLPSLWLGPIFIYQYYTEFDFGNHRIGFAPSK